MQWRQIICATAMGLVFSSASVARIGTIGGGGAGLSRNLQIHALQIQEAGRCFAENVSREVRFLTTRSRLIYYPEFSPLDYRHPGRDSDGEMGRLIGMGTEISLETLKNDYIFRAQKIKKHTEKLVEKVREYKSTSKTIIRIEDNMDRMIEMVRGVDTHLPLGRNSRLCFARLRGLLRSF